MEDIGYSLSEIIGDAVFESLAFVLSFEGFFDRSAVIGMIQKKRRKTPEVVSAYEEQRRNSYGDFPVLTEFRRKLGARGWLAPLAPQWPKEYGRVERSPEQKRILREELG